MSHDRGARAVIAGSFLLAFTGYLLFWFCLKPVTFPQSKSDFGCFYRAGKMILAGDGRNVYDLPAERRYDELLGTKSMEGNGKPVSLPFVFAPFVLAVFAPLAALPYRHAEFAWYAGNSTILLALPFLLKRRLGLGTKSCAVSLIAPLLFLPLILTLLQGQPSVVQLLLFAMSYADLDGGNEARAGCWLALASFKPQLVFPMLLALVIWRKKRALESFFLSGMGLAVVSFCLVGWHTTMSYPHVLLRYAGTTRLLGGEHPESMPNLRGILYLALRAHIPASRVQEIALAASLLLLGATLFFLGRRRQISPVSFSLVLVVTLLTSYHGYLHDDALLLLPMVVWGGSLAGGRVRSLAFLTVATLAAIFAVPLAPTSLQSTVVLMTAAIVVLAALMALTIHRSDRRRPYEYDSPVERIAMVPLSAE